VTDEGESKIVQLVQRRVDFSCFYCHLACIMYPRSKPIIVVHALPTCTEWEKVEKKKDDLERFLIKCGAHLHTPGFRWAKTNAPEKT
jgi:hypothetical protein